MIKIVTSICLFILSFSVITDAQELSKEIPWESAYKKQLSEVKSVVKSNLYEFNVVYKNDFNARYIGKIEYSNQNHSYFLKCNEGDIYPSQTKYIYRIVDNDTVLGLSNESCWLFRIDSGEISTYSVFAGNADVYVNYIKKKEDSNLYLFDELFIRKGLPKLMSDDPDALRLYKKANRTLLFRRFGSITILAVLVTTISFAKKESAIEIASALSIPVLPIIPLFFYPPTPPDIIRYYNSNKIIEKELGVKE